MIKNRKFIYLIILYILLIPTSACWDRQELSDMTIVSGIGLDPSPAEGHFNLTVQYIIPSNLSTPGGGGGTGEPFALAQGTGETFLMQLETLPMKLTVSFILLIILL